MIRVPVKACPSGFYKSVTRPGRQYLAAHPEAKGKIAQHIWAKGRNYVYDAYSGICAYCAVYGYEACGYEVDHFDAKCKTPAKAYEWKNLRLASRGMNLKKGSRSVIDPFVLPDKAYLINFFTGRLRVNKHLPDTVQQELAATIRTLGLNDQSVIDTRTVPFSTYRKGELSSSVLARRYPFVASEMLRQNYVREEDRESCRQILTQLGYR